MTTKAELCKQLEVSVDEFEKYCRDWSLVIDEEYSPTQVVAMREQFGKTEPTPQSTAIPTAREGAIALAATAHDAMRSLQSAGLENAAAYIQRKTVERNVVVDKVSDAIAYLSDPDLLEADIMSATAAKVKQRTNAWGYESSSVNLDELFALPTTSQRLIEEG